jgi:hypothetical protein
MEAEKRLEPLARFVADILNAGRREGEAPAEP